jgi:hypothetical protein
MRYAAIYKMKNNLVLCSNAQTTDGVSISTEPYVHLGKEVTALEIKEAIDKVITSNQYGIPHPKQNEWNTISKKHLEGLGVKSISELHKKANYCSIIEDDKVLTFCPTINAGNIGGYTFVFEKKISVSYDASPVEIFTALEKALRISEEITHLAQGG